MKHKTTEVVEERIKSLEANINLMKQDKMNERIEKLIDDAKLTTVSEMFKAELVNLANLIVKECADIALREDHDPSDCILRHFGVERNVSKCDTCDCMYPCRSSRNDKPWD